MAKRPDWAVKSWTALNINEFILFDMFESYAAVVVERQSVGKKESTVQRYADLMIVSTLELRHL